MAETECDMVVGETEMVGLKSVLSGSLMFRCQHFAMRSLLIVGEGGGRG